MRRRKRPKIRLRRQVQRSKANASTFLVVVFFVSLSGLRGCFGSCGRRLKSTTKDTKFHEGRATKEITQRNHWFAFVDFLRVP